MINSRKISDLLPQVAVKAEQFISQCKAQGIEVLIYSTFRDNESQAALYAQGRTAAGKIVTNAKAGHSFHNHRVAFDFVPMLHGKEQWNNDELYHKCGSIAQACGLEWGGAWKTFADKPHCQDTGGYTIEQFINKKVPTEWLKS